MTNSEQMAEKIKAHLANGGVVRFATCYRVMDLKAKHADYVIGSKLENDSGDCAQYEGKTVLDWLGY